MTVEASSPCCCQSIPCCSLSSFTVAWEATQGTTEFDLLCVETGGGVLNEGVRVVGDRAFVRNSTTPRVMNKQISIECRYSAASLGNPSQITGNNNELIQRCVVGFVVPTNGFYSARRVPSPFGVRWEITGYWRFGQVSGTNPTPIFDLTLNQYSEVNVSCPVGLNFVFNDAIGPSALFRAWNGSVLAPFTPSNLTLAGRFVVA